jgi:hypothetical protein
MQLRHTLTRNPDADAITDPENDISNAMADTILAEEFDFTGWPESCEISNKQYREILSRPEDIHRLQLQKLENPTISLILPPLAPSVVRKMKFGGEPRFTRYSSPIVLSLSFTASKASNGPDQEDETPESPQKTAGPSRKVATSVGGSASLAVVAAVLAQEGADLSQG